MKNIKFKKINKNHYYLYFIPLTILGVSMIFLNPFDVDVSMNKIYGLVPILLVFLVTNDFFLPVHKVEYNSELVRIKINSYFKKNIEFDQIETVNFTENTLTITLKNHNNIHFDLSNINYQSTIKLKEILNHKRQNY